MRLTRRGWAVLFGAGGGIVLAALFGARSLNAVVTPAIVALVIGAISVYRARPPTVARGAIAPGFPNDERTVRLRIDADRPVRVVDALGAGLRPDEAVVDTTGDDVVEYHVELARRGDHEIGPATVTVRDALGLLATTRQTGGRDTVLVYPQVLPVIAADAFAGLVDGAGTPDRQTFDRIREYRPGDPLRDVSWTASARQPGEDELVVVEFATEDEGGVTVLAECTSDGDVDRMASAAASVAAYLLDAGLEVAVAAPDGALDAGRGQRQRTAMLQLLARTGAGRAVGADPGEADVHVQADADGVTVTVRDTEMTFENLVDDRPLDGDTNVTADAATAPDGALDAGAESDADPAGVVTDGGPRGHRDR